MNTEFVYKDIQETLVLARSCSEIWWLLEGTHTERETIKESCNQYIEFFETVRPSMFITFVVLVSTLFDNGNDSISLKKIPDIQNDSAFDDLWNRGRKLYKEYRSKCIAHRDVKNDIKNYAQETGFSYNNIREILVDSIELYDRVAKEKGKVEVSDINIPSEKAFLNLMRRLTPKKAQQGGI